MNTLSPQCRRSCQASRPGKRLGLVALMVSLALASASGAQEAESALASMHGLGILGHHQLDSNALERSFHVLVRLPPSYDEDSSRRYPTVYLLDGGTTFPMLNAYASYLFMAREIPEVLMVGISYGTDDWQNGNFRSTDFTAESAEREHYGGAPKFQELLRSELVPLVEEAYRADSRRRIVFGQSLGGQFVLYSAITAPDLFWGHIASNPALHRNLDFFQQPHWPQPLASGGESRVFVSTSEFDDPRFRGPALEWIRNWSPKKDLPWELHTRDLERHNHFSAAPEAFRQGLIWLLRP